MLRRQLGQARSGIDEGRRADAEKQVGLLAVLFSLTPFFLREVFFEPNNARSYEAAAVRAVRWINLFAARTHRRIDWR